MRPLFVKHQLLAFALVAIFVSLCGTGEHDD